MNLIHLLLVIAFVGFICWIILQIPMPGIFRNVILGLLGFAVVIWALQILGVSTGFTALRFP